MFLRSRNDSQMLTYTYQSHFRHLLYHQLQLSFLLFLQFEHFDVFICAANQTWLSVSYYSLHLGTQSLFPSRQRCRIINNQKYS